MSKPASNIVQGRQADIWQCVYDLSVQTAVSSVLIEGLEGDTDKAYMLLAEIINPSAIAGSIYGIRLNGDAGNNYDYQFVYGSNVATGAARGNGNYHRLASAAAGPGYKITIVTFLQAESGTTRPFNSVTGRDITPTVVGLVYLQAGQWRNTTDEILNMTILSSLASGIGIGSRIKLHTRKYLP